MNGRADDQAFTIGQIVVFARSIHTARLAAEEAMSKHVPCGVRSGMIQCQAEMVKWHMLSPTRPFRKQD